MRARLTGDPRIGFAALEQMIDLHTHILPGLDDGAESDEVSMAMARRAVEDGVTTLVATPHLNFRYDFPIAAIARGVEQLNARLAEAGVPLDVVGGAELDSTRVQELSDAEIGQATVGDGPCLLVESPYQAAGGILDETLYELQLRGLTVVLAHPERCPLFQQDLDHLRRLVDRGVLCSVNAGSMSGVFGSTVRRFVLRLFSEGLVHDVSSDAHDPERRPPVLSTGLKAMKGDLPDLAQQWDHYTHDAPAAMLSGARVPSPPPPPSRPWWRRLLG